MTRRGFLIIPVSVLLILAGAYLALSRPTGPGAEVAVERECDSCTARHRDKTRLREALSNTEPETD